MADLREVFPILQDSTTGAGEAPISRIEGEASAAQEGLIGFSFKDSSGDVLLPQTNAGGAIPIYAPTPLAVDTEAFGGDCKSDYGTDASPVALTASDVATLDETVLSLTEIYDRFYIYGSCLRTVLWEVVYIDDTNGTPVETVLFAAVQGPGDFKVEAKLACLELSTTGGTGDQNIVLRGTCLNKASTLRGYIECVERAAT